MKNTKNFILVGATLLFSAISTGGFAQSLIKEYLDDFEGLEIPMDVFKLCQQWDSLYVANDADNLAKAFTEVVYVCNPDDSIKVITRAQIKNTFNTMFAKIRILSYSSQITDVVMKSDGTIRVIGTFVGMIGSIGMEFAPIQITGTYDRNVIYVDGKYKIFKHKDIVN